MFFASLCVRLARAAAFELSVKGVAESGECQKVLLWHEWHLLRIHLFFSAVLQCLMAVPPPPPFPLPLNVWASSHHRITTLTQHPVSQVSSGCNAHHFARVLCVSVSIRAVM